MPTSNDNATRALEWMANKLEEAKNNGYYLDKLSTMSVFGAPGALTGGARAGSTAGSGTGSGVSRFDLNAALDRAARAEAEVKSLTDRVGRLEAEVRQLAVHLEEAVGPHTEGEHKTHWWSRRH